MIRPTNRMMICAGMCTCYCLTSIYKVFALAFDRKISPSLDLIILKEQKGFIKSKYILDAIITLWESCDYELEEEIDFIF